MLFSVIAYGVGISKKKTLSVRFPEGGGGIAQR